ncbi:MAG TPA: choice-of-anchor D domain-containing protein [Kofleriaceae bacterium]
MRRLILVLAICVPAIAGASPGVPIPISPATSGAFPDTQIGSTSAPQSYTIEEVSPRIPLSESVTISYSCPNFTVTPVSGNIANTCQNIGCGEQPCIEPVAPTTFICTPDVNMTFQATFHPTVTTLVTCSLTIAGSSGVSVMYSLSGTGTPPPIHVTASPSSIAFGGVRVDTTSSAVNVTVTNSGGSAATISSVTIAGAGYAIASGTSTSHMLGAGASELHGVTCSPGETVGALGAGTLTITSNDPTTPTINIGLSCSGITSKIAVTPSPIVIPPTRVGEPVMQSISLENTGAATATIVDVTVTGMTMVSAPAANTQLAQNASAMATVSFDASAAGSASGNLHIDTDTTPLDIPITAQALATSMSLTPDGSVDFGPICVGQTKLQMFDVVADEDGAFQLTAVSQPAAPFAVTTPTLPAAVQGDAANTVSFSVTAAPTDVGSATSTIDVNTDIPMGQADTISLAVQGLPPGVTPTPAMLDLGTVAVQTTSQGQAITLSNCGASAVTIADAMITGDQAPDFTIVQSPTSTMVAANASATWLVVMNAQTVGEKDATFEIDYDGGSATVPITAVAYDPNAVDGSDGGTDKSSYYACSTGHATSLWPIGLALLALRRRRNRR